MNQNWGSWDGRGRGGPNRFGRGGGRGTWRSPGRFFNQRRDFGNDRGGGHFGNDRGGHFVNDRGGHFGNDRGGHFGQRNRGAAPQWKNRPKRDSPGKRLSEDAIGVTEYISDHPGFTGIIKSRYSDFQVSEINLDGEVAKLTTYSPPEPPVDETVDEDEDLLLTKYNVEILPLETWDSLNKVAVSKEDTPENIELDASTMSKEQRTKIHDAVKKAFGDSIVSSTVNIGDKKLLRFEKYRKGVRVDNRVKWIWPGEYVYFVVHKENCDTMDAAVRIAERLRLNIKPSMLGYAGTKDRRAKTSQWFSLRKVNPRKIALMCRGMHDVHVGNYSFSPVNLKLGMLKGNIFRIALRNVTASEECAAAACASLRERGFINYYGLQRFGTRVDTPTYEIGLKLLQGNLREAINSILKEREGPMQTALQLFRSAGPAAAARAVPAAAQGHIEARLLKALARAPNDLQGALNKLARNARLLYLHSYQSLIWNRAVSERVRRLGLAPAEGDLVPLGSDQEVIDNIDEPSEFDEEDHETESESESDKTEEKKPEGDDSTENSQEVSGEANNPKVKIQVKVLTKEDVESGQYTIFDIIMPMPGYNIEYPPNMKSFYEEEMAKDELTLELRHKIKCYAMSGAYRHVVVRPSAVTWQLVRYSDPLADLIQSDLAEMHDRQPQGIKEDGKYQALLLTMTLPASCYATMALRELLKVDTSGDNQALQNNYYKKDKKDEAKPDDKEENTEENATDKPQEDSGVTKTADEGETEMESEENGVEKRKLEEEDEVEAKKAKTDD